MVWFDKEDKLCLAKIHSNNMVKKFLAQNPPCESTLRLYALPNSSNSEIKGSHVVCQRGTRYVSLPEMTGSSYPRKGKWSRQPLNI